MIAAAFTRWTPKSTEVLSRTCRQCRLRILGGYVAQIVSTRSAVRISPRTHDRREKERRVKATFDPRARLLMLHRFLQEPVFLDIYIRQQSALPLKFDLRKHAEDIVRFMVKFTQMPDWTPERLKALCLEYNFDLEELVSIAHYFYYLDSLADQRNELGDPHGRPLSFGAQSLLKAAAEAGSASATVEYVRKAHINDSLHNENVKTLLPRLRKYAENGDISAMILQARLDAQFGKAASATKLLEVASELAEKKADQSLAPSPTIHDVLQEETFTIKPEHVAGEAWRELGWIRFNENDLEGAKAAFVRAADKWGDPIATVDLASMYPVNTLEWLDYTIRAAAAGHGLSAYKVGVLYSSPNPKLLGGDKAFVEQVLRPNRLMSTWRRGKDNVEARYMLGLDWLQIALKLGFLPSVVEIAKLYWHIEEKLEAIVLLFYNRHWGRIKESHTNEDTKAYAELGRLWKMYTSEGPLSIAAYDLEEWQKKRAKEARQEGSEAPPPKSSEVRALLRASLKSV